MDEQVRVTRHCGYGRTSTRNKVRAISARSIALDASDEHCADDVAAWSHLTNAQPAWRPRFVQLAVA